MTGRRRPASSQAQCSYYRITCSIQSRHKIIVYKLSFVLQVLGTPSNCPLIFHIFLYLLLLPFFNDAENQSCKCSYNDIDFVWLSCLRMDHIGSKEPRSLLPSTSERIREKQATRMFREQVGHLAAWIRILPSSEIVFFETRKFQMRKRESNTQSTGDVWETSDRTGT